LEDAVLLERCRSGDMSAFGALVGRYQDRVYNAVLRMCGNPDDAEEICQEAFVKALESLASFRQASGFYTWLFRIAVNLAISRRRRGARVKFHSFDPAAGDGQAQRFQDAISDRGVSDPSQAAQQRDANERVIAALGELEDDFRVVVVLRDVEDMDYEQMSQVLSLPVGTVKSRLYRARRLLQEKLKGLL
jgi:RNA polymerase sigma-70 factor (ECF subfamily)